YAAIVREHSIMRQLIHAGDQITGMGFNTDGRSAADLLEAAETEIFAIAERGRRGGEGPMPLNTVLAQTVKRIEELFENQGQFPGTPTGLARFDEMTNGLQQSDLVIIAGRPSMGKTSFAMNIVENVAFKEKVPVAVFSLEMSAEQLAMRMISSWGRVDQARLRSGHLNDEDWPKVTSAIGIMNQNANLFIDDTPALSPSELRARARRLKREHDIGLVVVDYLQLMQVPGTQENRTNEISEISRN